MDKFRTWFMNRGRAWLFIIGLGVSCMMFNYFSTPATPRAVATPVRLVATATIRPPTPTKTQAVIPTLFVPTKPPILRGCATGSIYIRSGPGTDNNIVGGLISSDCVNVVGRNHDGSWVMIDSFGGNVWVMASLLEITGNVESLAIQSSGGGGELVSTQMFSTLFPTATFRLNPLSLPTNPPTFSGTLTPLPTKKPATAIPANCDPHYPTICVPPPPPDLDCGDIPHKRFQVLPPDPHNFDRDGDGIGCES